MERPDDVRLMTGAGTPESVSRIITSWKRRIREAGGGKQLLAVVKTGSETLSGKKDRFVDVEAGGVRIDVTESTPMGANKRSWSDHQGLRMPHTLKMYILYASSRT